MRPRRKADDAPTRRARDGATFHTGDGNGPPYPSLLALYPGIRQTGWAVLAVNGQHDPGIPAIAASGTAGLKAQQRVEPAQRIAHLLETLSGITGRWRPGIVVCSNAGGLTSRAQGREELDAAIKRWATAWGCPWLAMPRRRSAPQWPESPTHPRTPWPTPSCFA